MKFGISKRETLALVAFAIGRPTANLEEGETRIAAWEDLGASELAFGLSESAAVGAKPPSPETWIDAEPRLVDLQPATLRFLLKQLQGEIPGVFSDILRALQRRLLRLEAKTYELPRVLRNGDASEPATSDPGGPQ